MPTFKNVVKTIEAVSLGHKQIRSFFHNVNRVEWLNERQAKYPAVFLYEVGAVISTGGQATTINLRLFVTDLVNVSEDTKSNELDVQSDMFSVAQDLIAQLNYPSLDWILSSDNPVELIVEGDNDMHAGIVVDFSIRFAYKQNICEIPTLFTDYTPVGSETDVSVYDVEYVANGTEGLTLTIPAIIGKLILLVTRESSMLFAVSNAPGATEYVWNGSYLTLGLPTVLGNRFLILYRNF